MIIPIVGVALVLLGLFCVWFGPASVDPHAGDGGFGLGVFLLGFLLWAIGTLLVSLGLNWRLALVSLVLLAFWVSVVNYINKERT